MDLGPCSCNRRHGSLRPADILSLCLEGIIVTDKPTHAWQCINMISEFCTVHFIYLGLLQKCDQVGGSVVQHALRMLCSVLLCKITFHTIWAVCVCNNGANTVAQNISRSVTTCLAVPLHKPGRDESNQNQHYGVKTPRKLTRIIHLWIKRVQCRVRNLHVLTAVRKLAQCYRIWLVFEI
jgi:hypothetical protein